MNFKIYEDKNYVCHNHGITELLMVNKIGDIRFLYQPFIEQAESHISKEEFTKMVTRGELFMHTETNSYFYSTPLFSIIKLKKESLDELYTIRELNENVVKFIDYILTHPKEVYRSTELTTIIEKYKNID